MTCCQQQKLTLKFGDKSVQVHGPKNCEMLSATKVKRKIWGQIFSGSWTFDFIVQRVQQSVTKGLMPIIDCYVNSNFKNSSKQLTVSDETVNHMTSLLGIFLL